MSESQELEFAFDICEFASPCLLAQCLGCEECQTADFLAASSLIKELQGKIEEAQEEIEKLKKLRQDRCFHHLIVSGRREACRRCGIARETPPTYAEPRRKCVREECANDAEAGTCPKHNRLKLACSLGCYKIWKAAQGPQTS